MNIYFLILILTQFYLTNEMENPGNFCVYSRIFQGWLIGFIVD